MLKDFFKGFYGFIFGSLITALIIIGLLSVLWRHGGFSYGYQFIASLGLLMVGLFFLFKGKKIIWGLIFIFIASPLAFSFRPDRIFHNQSSPPVVLSDDQQWDLNEINRSIEAIEEDIRDDEKDIRIYKEDIDRLNLAYRHKEISRGEYEEGLQWRRRTIDGFRFEIRSSRREIDELKRKRSNITGKKSIMDGLKSLLD